MESVEQQIRALVDAETTAWNARDAEALVSLFHPDSFGRGRQSLAGNVTLEINRQR